MNRVYKYAIEVNDVFELQLPEEAWILTVQVQNREVYLWALVDPDLQMETRRFRLVGTGYDITEGVIGLSYIGTFQLESANFVGHLFEIHNV